jgi:catalase
MNVSVSPFSNKQTGKLWNSLNQDEKKELLIAYKESFNSADLIDHEEVKKRHGKWLKKIVNLKS